MLGKRTRRKPREAALRGGKSGRGRHGSGRGGFGSASKQPQQQQEVETDESEENKDPALGSSLRSLNDADLTALTRPPRTGKYNFFVDLSKPSPLNYNEFA